MQVTAGVAGAPEAMKPHVVLADAPRPAFQPASDAVTLLVPDTAAFQAWFRLTPPGKAQDTVQPEIAAGPAVTVTSPCQPPPHDPITLIAAEHDLPPPDVVVVVVVVVLVVVVVAVVVVVGRDEVVVVVVVVGGVPSTGTPFKVRFVAGPSSVVQLIDIPVLADAPGASVPL